MNVRTKMIGNLLAPPIKRRPLDNQFFSFVHLIPLLAYSTINCVDTAFMKQNSFTAPVQNYGSSWSYCMIQCTLYTTGFELKFEWQFTKDLLWIKCSSLARPRTIISFRWMQLFAEMISLTDLTDSFIIFGSKHDKQSNLFSVSFRLICTHQSNKRFVSENPIRCVQKKSNNQSIKLLKCAPLFSLKISNQNTKLI